MDVHIHRYIHFFSETEYLRHNIDNDHTKTVSNNAMYTGNLVSIDTITKNGEIFTPTAPITEVIFLSINIYVSRHLTCSMQPSCTQKHTQPVGMCSQAQAAIIATLAKLLAD